MYQVCHVCQVILEEKLFISRPTILSIYNSKKHLTHRTPRTLLNNQNKIMYAHKLIIKDLWKLDPQHPDDWIILAECNPIMKDKNRTEIPNYNFTGYHYRPGYHPSTYTDYHTEKLGITEQEGKVLIDEWNHDVLYDHLILTNFTKIITIPGGIKFGVIPSDSVYGSMVVMNRFAGHKDLYAAGNGCNGFSWHFLDPNTVPTDDELIAYFNLRLKSQREKFRIQW